MWVVGIILMMIVKIMRISPVFPLYCNCNHSVLTLYFLYFPLYFPQLLMYFSCVSPVFPLYFTSISNVDIFWPISTHFEQFWFILTYFETLWLIWLIWTNFDKCLSIMNNPRVKAPISPATERVALHCSTFLYRVVHRCSVTVSQGYLWKSAPLLTHSPSHPQPH